MFGFIKPTKNLDYMYFSKYNSCRNLYKINKNGESTQIYVFDYLIRTVDKNLGNITNFAHFKE